MYRFPRVVAEALAALALLGGCAKQPPAAKGDEPRPALWEVRSAAGEVEGWLFGTVHALPQQMAWRSATLEKVIADADLLVVEVANLDDGKAMADVFSRLAYNRQLPPLRERISPALRDEYDSLLTGQSDRVFQLDRMETWAAALALAQLAQDGEESSGADLALIRAFKGRQIKEVEGAARQLAIFDRLPEQEQRDLLDAILVETAQDEGGDQEMADAWRRGDIDALAMQMDKGILDDPELREALLAARNRAWADQLVALLAAPGRPLVAVGAGHLAGNGSLVELMQDRGFVVRRVE